MKWIVGLAALFSVLAGTAIAAPAKIIDVHLHAMSASDQGPPPQVICAPYDTIPTREIGKDAAPYGQQAFKTVHCAHPVWSSADDAALQRDSLAELKRYDILAVTSGEADRVDAWRKAAPERIIPALAFSVSDAPSIQALRDLHKAGKLAVMGEIGAQYEGLAPNDPRLEPYYALAEELDIPLGIHVGPGPPGATALGIKTFRMSAGDPLLLEDVLVKHPNLRLYVMHAGWPNIDHMIALMYAHPQVYVDTGVIDYTQPRAEFHRYLRRLVEAGYGERIMFGSDQMVWPKTIGPAIEGITSADFLTPAQ
ncbi:MAG: amidohydrolase family protein, partial [Pseudomonadota bacterium]|nr:amidohydrolase family protein [Pseudomonadota bacterium]